MAAMCQMQLSWKLTPEEQDKLKRALDMPQLSSSLEWATIVKDTRQLVLRQQQVMLPLLNGMLSLLDYTPERDSILCKVQAVLMALALLSLQENAFYKAVTKTHKLDVDALPKEVVVQMQQARLMRRAVSLNEVFFADMHSVAEDYEHRVTNASVPPPKGFLPESGVSK